jgi:hypothetical protein
MTDESNRRFPIRFTGLNKAMAVLGLRSTNSYVDVGPLDVTVRLGWAFRATFDRSSVVSVDHDHDRVLGWGAHGWKGVWLVNGSSSGIVRVELDGGQRARVAGVPVTARCIRVSVEDPDGLIAALGD